jgi:hypothetical protein
MATGRPKNSSIIKTWLDTLSDEDKLAFRDYCKAHYHQKGMIHAYLIARGCEVSLATVYNWIGANIPKGEEAVLLDQEAEAYRGVDITLQMEKLFASLARMVQRCEERLQGVELSPEKCAELLPQFAREMRAVGDKITNTKAAVDTELLIMSGAMRMFELIVATGGIKDTADETFVRKACESAILRIREEVKSKTLSS